jgi:hypothetical protein
MGDTAFLSRAFRLRSAADTTYLWRKQNAWYLAARRGDTAQANAVFENMGSNPDVLLNSIIRHTLFDGTGAEQARVAIEKFVQNAPTDVNRRARARYAHDVMLGLGRPGDAMRYLAASKDSAHDLNASIITLRDASMGEIPDRLGVAAAAVLAPYEKLAEPTDSAGRDVQRAIIRVMEPWRLSHGDTSQTRKSIQRLRTIARSVSPSDAVTAETEIAFIEMMHADVAGSASLRHSVERLDSLLLLQDVSATATSRLAQETIVAARIWEKLGEPQRALSMIGRYPVWSTENVPYLGLQLREQGRIAVIAGDHRRAIRAYSHYLGMRVKAEPAKAAEVDSVKRELARIEATSP